MVGLSSNLLGQISWGDQTIEQWKKGPSCFQIHNFGGALNKWALFDQSWSRIVIFPYSIAFRQNRQNFTKKFGRKIYMVCRLHMERNPHKEASKQPSRSIFSLLERPNQEAERTEVKDKHITRTNSRCKQRKSRKTIHEIRRACSVCRPFTTERTGGDGEGTVCRCRLPLLPAANAASVPWLLPRRETAHPRLWRAGSRFRSRRWRASCTRWPPPPDRRSGTGCRWRGGRPSCARSPCTRTAGALPLLRWSVSDFRSGVHRARLVRGRSSVYSASRLRFRKSAPWSTACMKKQRVGTAVATHCHSWEIFMVPDRCKYCASDDSFTKGLLKIL